MNPPSAIQNAMGRERKPFTYTPGGLDLSEIKSERMARRLMRNAMSQGVPEAAVPSIQSPSVPTTPVAIPNFNCLPVQVFPSISLPANPKSLLRTRSNPSQVQEPVFDNLPQQSQLVYNKSSSVVEKPYESKSMHPIESQYFSDSKNYNSETNSKISDFTCNDNLSTNINISNELISKDNPSLDIDKENIQKEVKVVKKQVKKEKRTEDVQNGDNDTEAELTIESTPKTSAAKTETSVEVVKKVGPGGEIEEIKTTTTKTTVNGKTEVKTKTETKKIPAQTESEEEELVEEEEEEEEEIEDKVEEKIIPQNKSTTVVQKTAAASDEEEKDGVIKEDEKHEVTTTKKVVVVQKTTTKEESEEEEEIEEEEENEKEEPQVQKIEEKPKTASEKPAPVKQLTEEEEEEEEESEYEDVQDSPIKKVESDKETIETKKPVKKLSTPEPKSEEEEEEKEEVENEEKEEEQDEEKVEKVETTIERNVEKTEVASEVKETALKENEEDLEEEEEEEEEENGEEEKKEEVKVEVQKEHLKSPEKEKEPLKEKEETIKEKLKVETETQKKEDKPPQNSEHTERKIPIFTESVESVEIKPIGPHETISKSHTETTEIRSTINEALGRPISTQTELHRIENLVTVNRTTKTLDQAYEQITQHGVPTVKTYFAPSRDRVSTSPQPARPYESSYTSDPITERRHSLLLERLSTERQIPPTETYHSTYQTHNSQSYESNQNQWSQEPQSEVINVSNVKPSSITNQQWYQQTRKDNVIYNNVGSTVPESAPTTQTAQQWIPPVHVENYTQDYSKTSTADFKQDTVPNYTPKPNTWGSTNLGQINTLPTINPPSNQYSFLSKDSTDSYQKSTQQYSSTYVPPPWETDVNYATKISEQNYYQPPPPTSTFVPGSTPGWKPTPPATKFTKPAPTCYLPPKPNQSFVKPVVAQPPKVPGRKTYYSEYERRYISVPESTYIPTETKYQAQPDPSPQYYYDNNEPIENVEHTWRKELREFTEKTSQTQYQVQESTVKPPWEEDSKYSKAPTPAYTPTPTWSQTLRPRSWRERSFESELNTQEWPKSNTLGRGRPLSSYVSTPKEPFIPEKPRGVSVDRYNPTSYTSPLPAEHPPAQTYTLSPTPSAKLYHNPNVPAYHTRASAEPREHPVTHPRTFKEPRSSPIQSRSFKYLQWITGTED